MRYTILSPTERRQRLLEYIRDYGKPLKNNENLWMALRENYRLAPNENNRGHYMLALEPDLHVLEKLGLLKAEPEGGTRGKGKKITWHLTEKGRVKNVTN